jgi:signal transduction histidine kinase
MEEHHETISNLCKNSVEALPEEGPYSQGLSFHCGGPPLQISDDTGIGIPAGIDVFELFRTTKLDAAGLRLPLVGQIVSAHRG